MTLNQWWRITPVSYIRYCYYGCIYIFRWGGESQGSIVILVISECIRKAPAVMLFLSAFDDTGSLGYPPRRMVYPRGYH